jgi:hypothetical protein
MKSIIAALFWLVLSASVAQAQWVSGLSFAGGTLSGALTLTPAPAGQSLIDTPGTVTPVYGDWPSQRWELAIGSAATPITTAGPALRASLYQNMLNTSCGNNKNDTACSSAGVFNAVGPATTTMVTGGIFAGAISSATAAGMDAIAVNASGQVSGSGVGIGTGAYLEGRRNTNTGLTLGAEITAINHTSSDCTYSTTAISQCDGIWVSARGLTPGPTKDSAAVHVGLGDAFGFWRVGLGTTTGSVLDTSIDLNDSATTGFKLSGTHTTALSSSTTSGSWGFGIASPTAFMHVNPPPTVTLTTSQAQSGATALLPFVSTSGAVVGQVAQGTSIPLGTQITSIVSTAEVSLTANGISNSGQKVVTTTATAGTAVGQQCTDTTTPTAIGAGNVIASIQAGVSITMTSNLVANTANADTIVCDPVITLNTATTGTISAGAAINFYTNHTALSTAASFYNPGDAGIAGNLSVGSLLVFGVPSAVSGAIPAGSAVLEGRPGLGGVYAGSGTTNDVTIQNKNGTTALGIPTGTTVLNVVGGIQNNGVLLVSPTAPTIASGGCTTGSAQSISASNGSAAFEITLGGATCGSTITLTLPAAAHNWVCDAHNITTPASNVLDMTGTASTTAVVLTNYVRTTGVAGNFTGAEKLAVKCLPY